LDHYFTLKFDFKDIDALTGFNDDSIR